MFRKLNIFQNIVRNKHYISSCEVFRPSYKFATDGLCMYVLVIFFLISDSRLAIFGKETVDLAFCL